MGEGDGTDGALPAACRRVAEAAAAAGLEIDIRLMPESTRTAEEAAAACGCAVGQIVKSLVFRGRDSGRGVLLLVAGDRRVDADRSAAALGEALDRPDARWVREATGFAIGGIPPLGHAAPMDVLMDPALRAHERVWAAAGTPRSVFAVAPDALRAAAGARLADIAA